MAGLLHPRLQALLQAWSPCSSSAHDVAARLLGERQRGGPSAGFGQPSQQRRQQGRRRKPFTSCCMMDGLTWEEKYLRLRDDHTSLTQKANEQDDTIRRMNTKLSQIEKSLKLKYRLENNPGSDPPGGTGGVGGQPMRAPSAGGGGPAGIGCGDGGGFGQPRNRENEQLVEELHRYNGALLRENSDLKAKIKSLNDALLKKKKELVSARLARTRATGAGPPGPRSPCPAARSAGMRSRHVQLAKKRSADDMDAGATTQREDRKLAELVNKLRQRVSNAEEQLKEVRAENTRLRQDKLDAGCTPEDAHEQAMAAAAFAHREPAGGRVRSQDEVETLHRELREAQLRDVRRELQDVLHERDIAVARGGRVDDLEETVSELRRHNRELENQVTRLCENPFISQAFRDQERSERVMELEQGNRAAQLKIDHLQETAQTHHAALVTLKKQTVRLREGKERAERALHEMRVRHNETEAGAQLMADKMKLYAGDEDIDLEELERALTIVKRKMADPEGFPGFLENPEDEEMDNVPALRRKLQRVQVSNLNLTRELERAERMLKAQMSINRDLHVELEEACRRSTLDRGELGQKLRDFEALALERLTMVHRLEAQVKQLLYGPARRQRLGAAGGSTSAMMEQEQESALLSELAEGDFSADQNIVEVWVVGAELEPGVLSVGSSSFVVVDFFDFESQATPLLPGVSPAFDFATTFKVTVDDFFLRYLGTEGLVLELNQARAADFELVGRRQVALSGLLSSKPRIILQREPLISTRDGGVIGYVHVEIRMALPVTELYALFLERRPEEKERVEQARLLEAKAHGYLTQADAAAARRGTQSRSLALHGGGSLSHTGIGDTTRLRNELEVMIVGCRGLPSRGDRRGQGKGAPAAYVHYQLLGFQDVFTSVVHGLRDPSFRHSTCFPVATDDKLLRFLARHRLVVTVMDDLANNKGNGSASGNPDAAAAADEEDAWPDDDESEGLIGEALIDLSPLAEGRPVVAEWVTVEDATGKPAGKISVSARWLKPLRTGADPGPHGLSSEEVEGLMARFSPEKDGQVNYVAFLRESDPPPAVLAALGQIHSFLAEAAEQDGFSATEALGAVLGIEGGDPGAHLSEETFVSALLSSERVTASPDELAAAYAHASGGIRGGRDTSCHQPLTLEHLAAFATYGGGSCPSAEYAGASGGGYSDWASWVGAARPGDGGVAARRALVKARVKCRDAGLLGRPFPGEVFARLDPEGAGRVGRPVFKRALREMGFALVDEAPEHNRDGLLGGDAEWRALKKERETAGCGERGTGGALGRLVEESSAAAANGDEEVRLRRVDGEDREEERRNAFREKVKDIERATAEKVDAAEALSGGSSKRCDPPGDGIEPRLASVEAQGEGSDGDRGEGGLQHHPSSTVVKDSGARAGPAIGRLGRDAAASLLQSRFRGYRTRKGIGGRDGGFERGGAGSGKSSLLELEDFIDSALDGVGGGTSPTPDFRAAFAKLDKDSTGFLDRARFALALRSLRPSLGLPPELLRAAMDSFEVSGERGGDNVAVNGSTIDYRAFTIFCEERRSPEVSPAVNLLARKPLHPGALDVFARRDPMGTGFVCRLRHLATMFEEAEDMVDYASLVAFASEQPTALRAAAAVSRLRGHMLALRDGKGLDLRATLDAFAIGNDDDGRDRTSRVLRLPQLDNALRELGFPCAEDEKRELYNRLDPSGGVAGISCVDLVGFIEGPVDNHGGGPVAATSNTLVAVSAALAAQDEQGVTGKLLRRAQATIVEAAQRMDSDFEAFDKPYLRYDWRRAGRVGTAEFVRSTVRRRGGNGWGWKRQQLHGGEIGNQGAGNRHPAQGGEEEEDEEEEAELKVRTALQRMGEEGISRAWEEFERADPGGKRGGVREEELVEVLATLGLPVTARDVAGLMRRFSTANHDRESLSRPFFLYPRLLQTVVGIGGRNERLNLGRPQDILHNIRAELRRLVRRKTTGIDDGIGRRPAALRAFESLDRDGSGRVSRRDFRHALRELGFDRLGDEEAAEILDHFDPHGDGSICYADFLRELEKGADEDEVYRRSPLRGSSPSGKNIDGGQHRDKSTSARGRLEASVRRAIERGIDYRREMELEEEGAGAGREKGLKEGTVSRQTFRTTMKRIRADLSEGELRDLENRFAAVSGSTAAGRVRGGGAAAAVAEGVRYVELLRWGAPRRVSGVGDNETWAEEERLRQMIRRRFDIWIPGALKKAFRHFDARRKAKVSEADLSDGLRRLGLELTTRQERALFKAMDLDGRGHLVYPDLVVFARDPNHHEVRDKILRQLRRVTESRIRGELERKDPSDSGVVSEQALAKVLGKLGVDLAGADLGRLMHRFDVHEDGTASIERVLSFFLCGENFRDGDSDDGGAAGIGRTSNPRSPGRGGRQGRGYFSNDGDDDGGGVDWTNKGSRNSVNRNNAGSRGKRKGVTFRDRHGSNGSDDSDDFDGCRHRSDRRALLRASLRRIAVSAAGGGNGLTAASAESTGNSVGPGLRGRLRGALRVAADARGASRSSECVDRETVRRAMVACGVPLESKLLSDLERLFDHRGTGEINVDELTNYMAGEVEADIWERVAAEMVRAQARSSVGGELVRDFISDLGRVVDGRKEISRRELRKALERQGVTSLMEEEVLLLCDSLDPARRGRVRLSDVRDSLYRGMIVAGRGSDGEDEYDDDSSTDSGANTVSAVLDDLRLLVRAAERERGVDLLESFEHFDRRGQGEVAEDEFWEGLQSLGLGRNLSRAHVSRVVKSFKGRKHGHIRYKDFVKAMTDTSLARGRGFDGGGTNRGARSRQKGGRAERRRRSSADQIERLVDRLKAEIARLTEEEDGPPPFRQVFEAADHRGLGTLPSLAFRRCLLEGLGLDLTEAECEALLEYLDTSGDNNISYREFLQFIAEEAHNNTPPHSYSPLHSKRPASAGRATAFSVSDDLVHSSPRRRQYASPPGRRIGRDV
eukprot:g6898.t1